MASTTIAEISGIMTTATTLPTYTSVQQQWPLEVYFRRSVLDRETICLIPTDSDDVLPIAQITPLKITPGIPMHVGASPGSILTDLRFPSDDPFVTELAPSIPQDHIPRRGLFELTRPVRSKCLEYMGGTGYFNFNKRKYSIEFGTTEVQCDFEMGAIQFRWVPLTEQSSSAYSFPNLNPRKANSLPPTPLPFQTMPALRTSTLQNVPASKSQSHVAQYRLQYLAPNSSAWITLGTATGTRSVYYSPLIAPMTFAHVGFDLAVVEYLQLDTIHFRMFIGTLWSLFVADVLNPEGRISETAAVNGWKRGRSLSLPRQTK
ncbi:hypothetical protein HDU99_001808 [Rhizoclosmatium hyalinum]|nr:hypothetical protein HDU99_001808 [Rhizoclosmatium hyalinum]